VIAFTDVLAELCKRQPRSFTAATGDVVLRTTV